MMRYSDVEIYRFWPVFRRCSFRNTIGRLVILTEVPELFIDLSNERLSILSHDHFLQIYSTLFLQIFLPLNDI
jgi:hypothetical protein